MGSPIWQTSLVTIQELAEAKRDLAALERASRDAKPYKTHRAQLERRKDRLTRKRERAQEECEELQSQISELQSRLSDLTSENEARDKEISEVDAELRELLRKAIADGDDGSEAAKTPDPSAAWNTVSAALEGMAAQPGVPREWASQLGGLLEQLRAAAIAIQTQAAAASGASATAGAHAIGAPAPPTPNALGQPHHTTAAPAGSGGGKHDPSLHQQSNNNNGTGTGTAGNGGGPAPATPNAAITNTDTAPHAQGTDGGTIHDGSPAAAAAAAAETTGVSATTKGPESQRDSDLEAQDSDDDMWSIAEDDLDLREGESNGTQTTSPPTTAREATEAG